MKRSQYSESQIVEVLKEADNGVESVMRHALQY